MRKGRILVEALRPQGIPPSVREALADIEIGGGADDPALDAGWGEPGLSPAERVMAWNRIEVLAIGAGSPQRPVNAIPGEAVAHCQLRFVVGTPWRDLAAIVRAHLDSHGFEQVEVQVTLEGAATRLDLADPWVGWARARSRRSTGQRPDLLPNLAGSLPNDVFADLLGLPTLWVPHSYPACAQHAPNEHLLAPVAREGLQIMAGLFWDLGDAAANTPWHAASSTAPTAPFLKATLRMKPFAHALAAVALLSAACLAQANDAWPSQGRQAGRPFPARRRHRHRGALPGPSWPSGWPSRW